jgi:CHASE2 domain-containing sensor protein
MNSDETTARRQLRLAGMIIGLCGSLCALLAAYFALRAGHLARAVGMAGAGITFGVIGTSQYAAGRRQ